MKTIKVKKEDIKSSIGSLATDNNYFIEYHLSKFGENSFLYIEINNDFKFNVVLGNAMHHYLYEMSGELLDELIRSGKEILQKKKLEWINFIKDNPEFE